MKLFVGNIAPDVTDLELEELFKQHGQIRSVKIIRDMFSQASKGFGFVEMKDKSAGESAIKDLNAHELNGKKLVVNEARPEFNNRRNKGNKRTKTRNRGNNKGNTGRNW